MRHHQGTRPTQGVTVFKKLLPALTLYGSLCMPMAASAYVLTELGPGSLAKWGQPAYGSGANVTWSLMPGGTDCGAFISMACTTTALADFMPPNYVTTIQDAFSGWAAVANLGFLQVTDDGAAAGATTASGDIRFGGLSFSGTFYGSVGGVGLYPPEYLFAGNAWVGVGGSTMTGDIFFNTDLSSSFANSAYFSYLVAHEIGHTLGLSHTDVPNSLMNASRTLFNGPQADDIAGVQFIYGVPSPVPEPTTWVLFGLGMVGLLVRRCGAGARRAI